MIKKRHMWTEEERAVIREGYRGTHESVLNLAARLEMSVQSVRSQLDKSGARRYIYQKTWTPAEDEKLEQLVGKYAMGTVAKKMNRSLNSVTVRSKRLKISRNDRDGWLTKADVGQICAATHRRVQRWIDSGALKASWHHGVRPSQKGRADWHIEETDFIKFLRRYPDELAGRIVDIIWIIDRLAGITRETQ